MFSGLAFPGDLMPFAFLFFVVGAVQTSWHRHHPGPPAAGRRVVGGSPGCHPGGDAGAVRTPLPRAASRGRGGVGWPMVVPKKRAWKKWKMWPGDVDFLCLEIFWMRFAMNLIYAVFWRLCYAVFSIAKGLGPLAGTKGHFTWNRNHIVSMPRYV